MAKLLILTQSRFSQPTVQGLSNHMDLIGKKAGVDTIRQPTADWSAVIPLMIMRPEVEAGYFSALIGQLR